MTHNPLAAVVDALPLNEAIEPFQIMSRLTAAAGEGALTDLDRAELFAFNAVGMDPDTGPPAWGGYFGPFMSMRDADGVIHETPDLALVTPAWIRYWGQRSEVTAHPVAKARYADLVWDLSKTAGGGKPSIVIAQRAIDAHVASLRGHLHKYLGFAENVMARALDLARRTKDSKRARDVVEAILAYQAVIFEEDKLGTWTVAFDQLLVDGAPELAPGESEELEKSLETRYAAAIVGMAESGIPFPALELARRLATRYRRTNRDADAHRILALLVQGIPEAARKPSPLLGHAWLQMVDQLLRELGATSLRAELDRPTRELGAATLGDLKEISAEVRIPTERFEAYLATFTSLSDEGALLRIANHFTQSRAELDRQLRRNQQAGPIVSLFSTTRLDSRGRQVGTVGSAKDDPEGNLIALAAQNLQIGGAFLREIFDRLKQAGRLTPRLLGDFCALCPGAEPKRRPLLDRGLEAFVAGDAVVALHILVPCFEDTARELARLLGPLPMKYERAVGGYREPGLGKVLDHEPLRDLVGEDLILYWRALFTDSRGVNLRNQVAHGLLVADDCSLSMADRVVHSLLQLGLVRANEGGG